MPIACTKSIHLITYTEAGTCEERDGGRERERASLAVFHSLQRIMRACTTLLALAQPTASCSSTYCYWHWLLIACQAEKKTTARRQRSLLCSRRPAGHETELQLRRTNNYITTCQDFINFSWQKLLSPSLSVASLGSHTHWWLLYEVQVHV